MKSKEHISQWQCRLRRTAPAFAFLSFSWPGGTPGYALQQNLGLTTTNWVNVTSHAVLTNGVNQVTMPNNGSNLFYRLILSSP